MFSFDERVALPESWGTAPLTWSPRGSNLTFSNAAAVPRERTAQCRGIDRILSSR